VHPSRIIILIGFVAAAGSLALPFTTSPITGTTNGLAGDAWPAVLVLTPVALGAVVGDRREGFGRWTSVLAAFVGGVATVFAVQKLVDAFRAVQIHERVGIEAAVGPGPWVLVTGCLLVLVGAALSLSRRIG